MGTIRAVILFTTFAVSAAAWTYRFIDEYSPFREIGFYILTPFIIWLLFTGLIIATASQRQFLRVAAYVLLLPATLLLVLSVLVGLYGFRIH